MKQLIKNNQKRACLSALLSAVLFALCIPFAKLLGAKVPPCTMGGLLYLGAGIGLAFTLLLKKSRADIVITRKEIPYLFCVIALDISAILCLMHGISLSSGANASLLGNFELVSTSIAGFLIFKEKISQKLFISILLITIASMILTFEGSQSLVFNRGSLYVLISCVCWGFENNFTRLLSIKDTRQTTMIKGIFCGLGGLICAYIIKEGYPCIKLVFLTLLLGFISYGISVSLYIYAQRYIGAIKTGALYALAPYFGVIFSLIILKEIPQAQFYIALLIMIIGSFLTACDAKNS